jgi:hypothetical protein
MLEKSSKRLKLWEVYESKRHGATSGMMKHLSTHQNTEGTHAARLRGYTRGEDRETYTEKEGRSGKTKTQARLTMKEVTRRWVVKARQPFSVVGTDEFQEMFTVYGVHCAYKNRYTLRNHIYDDFALRRNALRMELEADCISIHPGMWTAPNRTPIFAVIGHWISKNFEEREEVLEFIEVTGSHTGEVLAEMF